MEYFMAMVCGSRKSKRLRASATTGRAPVWGEIHVVRIVHRDVLAGRAGERIDGRDAAVVAAFGVIVDPERFQIPGRHDMLWVDAYFKLVGDF
jgi:hypothetical protein